jgi:hypothetical protein
MEISVKTRQLALTLIPLVLTRLACAAVLPVTGHITDGIFSPSEWTGSTVNKSFFALAPDGSGNAWLYVDQGPSTLYLGYDYVGGTITPNAFSFFDVFFQVPNEHEDYGVRIHSNNTFEFFVKPFGPPSQIAADGSFDFHNAPWSPASSMDTALGQPMGAMAFGSTPNSSSAHVFVEFQLDINNNLGGRQPPKDGLYDPSPAFWSGGFQGASLSAAAADPPITSGIFTLNPDGTTIVMPVLGANGGPVQQIPEGVPEPSSLLLVLCGILALTWLKK